MQVTFDGTPASLVRAALTPTDEKEILGRTRPDGKAVFRLTGRVGPAAARRSELGLPRAEFLPALISFNVGVEAGQLAVIGIAYLLVGRWFGREPWYRRWITLPASAMIGGVGLYWTVQRIFL
ncbi:MAG TPA: HupE/UreJ family protein [Candidatus Polarisedimenticolaceae bacterium]|nr:HupE/UreJ family protein [Candidatus Polarisedimenticolaceae bacterium]